nr:uncharacterized protein LOC112493464 [Ziziphus jujuba var. spinosa]
MEIGGPTRSTERSTISRQGRVQYSGGGVLLAFRIGSARNNGSSTCRKIDGGVRMLFRATTTNPTASTSRLSSSSLSSVCSAFRPLQSQVSSPPSSRLVRRELASLGPIHTAIASACLVSKLPADPTICIEGKEENESQEETSKVLLK